MSPEGNKPVTFRIGLKEEKLIIEKIEGGYLKFVRKGEEGGIVNGILVQTENGVVERIVNH
ncbi:hypothetical protein HY772_04600 [Candidatus Woesearchaeota archaeon]|nr:hypothetical protein [Candidatus Woesearchaeota archaeon]